jgi:HEAT repeat protein
VSHEEVGEHLDAQVVTATLIDLPVKDLEGNWSNHPTLAVASSNKICVYHLLNPSEREETDSGENLGAQRGRIGEVAWRAEGVKAWVKHRLSSEDEATRRATVQTLVSWADSAALKSLERVAARDDDPALRHEALDALIASDHPSIIHALGRLLAAPHSKIACAALAALREPYGQDSLYPMRKALEVGQVGVSISALEALGDLGASGHDAARTLLKEQLGHEQAELAEVARQQLERSYPAPRGILIGLASKHDDVRTMALHRLLESDLTADPVVGGRLQQIREDESRPVRRYALAVTLLGYPSLADVLRAEDALLHEELNKVQARTLTGEDRATQLGAEAPATLAEVSFDERARQLLFEINAGGQADVAVHGPVALAQAGDLRALPTLLSLSRSDEEEVRVRATRGLASLAVSGERRARAQLQWLTNDDVLEVRQTAYRGLTSLFDEPLDHAEFGLSAAHTDVRLTALTALQETPRYQAVQSAQDAPDQRADEVLALALCRDDDLGLAQEARKIYLRDRVGGSHESALKLILGSTHREVREVALSDLISTLRGEMGKDQAGGGVGGSGGGFDGESFLFTATLEKMKRADAQKQVKALGGSNASSVTGSLNYLVVGDKGSAGSKLAKAQKLGVTVLTETQFWEMLERAAQPAVDSDADTGERGDDQASRDQALLEVMGLLFNDPSSQVRDEALKKLIGAEEGDGELKGERRLSAIDVALGAQSQKTRLSAIESLAGSADLSVARPRLRTLVADPDAVVARAALKAALKVADELLEEIVEEGFALEDDELRTLVVHAAAKASKKLSWREDVLLRAIADGVADIRDVAFAALRGDEVVSVAAKLLDHERGDIRDRAALTLARVGDERALSVALDVLQTPPPHPDDVIAAQEAQGGEFGLLDDLQWKRQVTLALSAQQRAFASASASAEVSDEDSGSESGTSVSARGVAYAEQSLHALVSVNDQIEGAVERAVRRWRERMSAALRVVREGRFELAFDAVWSIYQGRDEELSAQACKTLPSCVAQGHQGQVSAQLKADDPAKPLAWALLHLDEERGLSVLSSAGAGRKALTRGGLTLGGANAERTLAQQVASGGESAEVALYSEVLKLIHFGGDCPLIAAGLSSDQSAWRRTCAQWVSRAHDLAALKEAWAEEMIERRPQSDRDWEREMARFEADEVKQKPSGSRPHWMTDECWRLLAELLVHPESRARHYAASALFDLPTSSDSARAWSAELRRQHQLAQTCWARRAPEEQDARPLPEVTSNPTLALSESEAQALAFGTYASLVSGSKDAESLKSLSELFSTDPIGARAIIQMSLRDDGSLQNQALELLESHAETLGLSDVGRADLLISTDQPTCVKRGAQLLARVDATRAQDLILSDDGDGASSAAHALLELEPARGVELLGACLRSPNAGLRREAVGRWVGLVRAWPKAQKTLDEDDDKAMRSTRLQTLDLRVLRAVSAQSDRDEVLESLLIHLTGEDEQLASSDVQLAIAEMLRNERALTKRELTVVVKPLQRLLASTEPDTYRGALRALRDSEAKGAAQAILDRLMSDPTLSADPDETLSALSKLRDVKVVSDLIELMGDAASDTSRLDMDDLERCVLTISGHDQAIEEDAVWEEMDEEARKDEEKRSYQDATLAALIGRCAQLGRYDSLGYSLDLIETARTSRGAEVNDPLVKLTRLPVGDHDTDSTRHSALETLVWRVQHRDFNPEPLIELVDHRDLETRVTAAEALAYAQRSEGVKLLVGIARDRHEGYALRERSVNALGASGDLRAVQLLLHLFDDQEDCLRSEALEALSYMRDSEVADEILSRLIDALEDHEFTDVAIKGLKHFDHADGWEAIRRKLNAARASSWINKALAEALVDDSSRDVLPLFERVVAEADLYDSGTRVNAYTSWCSWLRRDAQASVDDHAVILEPSTHLFNTDLVRQSEWTESVEVIVDHGDAKLWVDLSFGAQKLSAKHQGVVGQFEAKLRELDPAPLDLLLPRLADAISDAPALARMTLSILGARAGDLSADHRAQLITATSDVRSAWLEREEERKAGADDPEYKILTELWRQLLWLWGRTEGGADALWDALHTPDARVELYREALFSLEARLEAGDSGFSVNARLIEAPVASVPELSPIVTRIAAQAGVGDLALSEDRAESLGGLSLGDWDALRHAQSDQTSATLLEATRRGDAMALSTLIGQGDSESVVTLLGEATRGGLDQLSEAAQRELVRSTATLGAKEVEDALVVLANATSDLELAREAWRARRRSARRRTQRQAQQRA